MKKAFSPSLIIGFVGLLVIGAIFIVRNAVPSPAVIDPTQISVSEPNKININTAQESDLLQIPGFGPATVSAILTYREENGPFKDTSELLNIPGIGEKKYLTLLEYIYLEE